MSEIVGDLVSGLPTAIAAALAVVGRELDAAYDGEAVEGMVYGTPEEARAWRALREQGEVEHFLRVFAPDRHHGEPSLAERASRFPLPIAEFADQVARLDERRMSDEEAEEAGLTGAPHERDDDPACFDWLTPPELIEWRDAWVGGAYTVADYLIDRARSSELAGLAWGEDAAARAVSELEPADLLLLAAAAEVPRGFAARDDDLYRRMQAIRKRVRRREKFLARVSE